ncbi:MAG: PEP-CTERM sorting domain-containing protein [Planctomycetes bacterium]|nr:PEP-CTERM sorting domain-containing protein [Planctomycetota bacterium]
MSNFNGLDGGDVLSLNADDHVHANMAFSETGLWAVTFEASGTHSVDGFVSGEATYFFKVVPEPATAWLTAAGCLLLLRRRAR